VQRFPGNKIGTRFFTKPSLENVRLKFGRGSVTYQARQHANRKLRVTYLERKGKLPITARRVTYPSGGEENQTRPKRIVYTFRPLPTHAWLITKPVWEARLAWDFPGPFRKRLLVTYQGSCRKVSGGGRGSYLPPDPTKPKAKKDHTRQSLSSGSFAREFGQKRLWITYPPNGPHNSKNKTR